MLILLTKHLQQRFFRKSSIFRAVPADDVPSGQLRAIGNKYVDDLFKVRGPEGLPSLMLNKVCLT